MFRTMWCGMVRPACRCMLLRRDRLILPPEIRTGGQRRCGRHRRAMDREHGAAGTKALCPVRGRTALGQEEEVQEELRELPERSRRLAVVVRRPAECKRLFPYPAAFKPPVAPV